MHVAVAVAVAVVVEEEGPWSLSIGGEEKRKGRDGARRTRTYSSKH